MELSDFDNCDDINGRYRDGMYEDNQMFAVYDKYDIIRLIDVLKGLISEESKDK